jgi:hydantoinase/carbamoylase family amidase
MGYWRALGGVCSPRNTFYLADVNDNSKPTETGMTRLALSDADKAARDWFVETTKALGCQVTIDSMGNTFAVRPGLKNDKPPTFVGSHLDTQPTGGRYDGILGVTAGVEMLRVLADNWTETEYPVGVVNWTNEEGARFPMSMVSSGVWAGSIPLETAHNLREVRPGTATMKSELERIGYLGSTPATHEAIPMAAHFELHIEQGPLLEMANKKVGIVTGVQAYKWFTVKVKGRDTHTGTTDLKSRADALLTASKLILHSHRYPKPKARLHKHSTRRSDLQPGHPRAKRRISSQNERTSLTRLPKNRSRRRHRRVEPRLHIRSPTHRRHRRGL